MIKVAIYATHPIQYHIPWFKMLARQNGIELIVCYGLLPNEIQQGVGFDIAFNWDIPMLDGYRWMILENASRNPDLSRFSGIRIRNIHKLFNFVVPDVAIITGWHSLMLLQVLIACSLKRIPCIVRGESNALYKRKTWIRLLHRLLVSRFSAFLAIGKSNAEFYLNNRVVLQDIFRCPYFIDNERFLSQFERLRGKRANLRLNWCIPEQGTCFIYVGKLVRKKRIMDLLYALQLALKQTTAIYLLVVGSGKLLDTAGRFARKNRLPVTFTGFLNQTEIVRAYVAADCLVLPSDYGETWGLVANEAMVCRLPVIVSNRVGCGPDLVKEGVTGAIFPFGDVKALAEKMIALAQDSGKRQEMGRRAQDLVLQDYSAEIAVSGTIRAIKAVLSNYNPN
jgi:glycosyltransferase involved in cell wall biosynthesis